MSTNPIMHLNDLKRLLKWLFGGFFGIFVPRKLEHGAYSRLTTFRRRHKQAMSQRLAESIEFEIRTVLKQRVEPSAVPEILREIDTVNHRR